jgi:hypothetical protein
MRGQLLPSDAARNPPRSFLAANWLDKVLLKMVVLK